MKAFLSKLQAETLVKKYRNRFGIVVVSLIMKPTIPTVFQYSLTKKKCDVTQYNVLLKRHRQK